MTGQRLAVSDAKSHMVVSVDMGPEGWQTRYMYRDALGWYVLDGPTHGIDNRSYVTVSDDGYFIGVQPL